MDEWNGKVMSITHQSLDPSSVAQALIPVLRMMDRGFEIYPNKAFLANLKYKHALRHVPALQMPEVNTVTSEKRGSVSTFLHSFLQSLNPTAYC